jgi:hypothetical protein
VSSCAARLASWDHSTGDQGSCTFFEVMGVLAHIPGCPTTPGGLALLMSGPGPHSQWGIRRAARVSKRPKRLPRCARSPTWVSNGYSSFLCGISNGAQGTGALTLTFQSSASQSRNALPHLLS